MKTFDKKDVFTLVTAEEAKAYIGKQGYFGDSFGELEEDIKKGCSGRLEDVFPDRYTSIVFRPYACETSYGLFLPVDKVKKVEEPKKYRPFTSAQELINVVCGGNPDTWITMRHKPNEYESTNTNVWHRRIQEYSDGMKEIIFGNQLNYNVDSLLNKWEWLDEQGEWQPFGVEE